jgi:3-deoxy-D-manno-octulosonate 8-phosphate phosphatase (KDO 8-P phosphatase)
MKNYKEQLKHITTFIFDYDGVLTDGTVIMMPNGDGLRVSSVKDGYAIQLAIKKGFRVAVISGAQSESMMQRLKALQVKDIFLGVDNKVEVFRNYINKHNIPPSQVLYMGDDIPDYEIMKLAGVPVCPSDAAEEIRNAAVYISHYAGGKGCARDVIEQVLKVQAKWQNDDAYQW